jgi:hypothetical protein
MTHSKLYAMAIELGANAYDTDCDANSHLSIGETAKWELEGAWYIEEELEPELAKLDEPELRQLGSLLAKLGLVCDEPAYEIEELMEGLIDAAKDGYREARDNTIYNA